MNHVRTKRTIVAALGVVAMAIGCQGQPGTEQETASAASSAQRYIVEYSNAAGRSAAINAAGGRVAVDLAAHGAVALYLPEAALAGLSHNPNIASIELDPQRKPLAEVTPYGVTKVQANLVPATPPTGDAGRIKLCIIDSGYNRAHEDLGESFVNGTNVSGTGNWFEDRCGHGSHVAGTIAALSGNGIGVTSVAGGAANLHIVKVFGDDCSWTYASSLVSALDICRNNGARVVSMSLGGGRASKIEERAFNNAFAAGVLSVAAAGNDGNTTKSYPASYGSVLSVAATDSSDNIASFSQQNDAVDIAAPGVAVLSTYPYVYGLNVGGTEYAAEGIEGAALGVVTGQLVDGGLCDSVGAGWAGKVVLCQRGNITFFDKVSNVQNGGGIAAVIYNNVSGGFAGTLGAGNSSTIPAVTVSLEDGQTILANQLGQSATVTSAFGSGYAELSGTSMATPHVSAVAALIWSQLPGRTNVQVRDALLASTRDLGAPGRDNAFGYGLVQARAALDVLTSGPLCHQAGYTCSSNSECCSGACVKRATGKTCN